MTREYEVVTNDPWAFVTDNSDPLLMVSGFCPHGLRWRRWGRVTPELVGDAPALEAYAHIMDPLPCTQHVDVPAYMWPIPDADL